MNTSLTKIGNSKGIIIPAHIIKQCGFENHVSLEIKNNALIISNARTPREGWKDAFLKNQSSENAPLLADFSNDFDESEWTW